MRDDLGVRDREGLRGEQEERGHGGCLHGIVHCGNGAGPIGKISTLPQFLKWFAGHLFADDRPKGVDEAFRFLQACEFAFPRAIAAIQALVSHAAPGADPQYGPYIAALESWFRPPWMKQVDEAGIPLPLAERLKRYLAAPENRREAIEQISNLTLEDLDLSAIDKLLLNLALDR